MIDLYCQRYFVNQLGYLGKEFNLKKEEHSDSAINKTTLQLHNSFVFIYVFFLKKKFTLMIAENLHAGLCVRIVSRLEA